MSYFEEDNNTYNNMSKLLEQSDLFQGVQALPGEIVTGTYSNLANIVTFLTLISAVVAIVLMSRVDSTTTFENYFSGGPHTTAHITGAVFAGVTLLLAISAFFLHKRGGKCDRPS